MGENMVRRDGREGPRGGRGGRERNLWANAAEFFLGSNKTTAKGVVFFNCTHILWGGELLERHSIDSYRN
jgi:hypothetical protein